MFAATVYELTKAFTLGMALYHVPLDFLGSNKHLVGYVCCDHHGNM